MFDGKQKQHSFKEYKQGIFWRQWQNNRLTEWISPTVFITQSWWLKKGNDVQFRDIKKIWKKETIVLLTFFYVFPEQSSLLHFVSALASSFFCKQHKGVLKAFCAFRAFKFFKLIFEVNQSKQVSKSTWPSPHF